MYYTVFNFSIYFNISANSPFDLKEGWVGGGWTLGTPLTLTYMYMIVNDF